MLLLTVSYLISCIYTALEKNIKSSSRRILAKNNRENKENQYPIDREPRKAKHGSYGW